MNYRIPKRIIQTGKTNELTLIERAAVANVRLLNPDYEYLYFDNKKVEEFIDATYPEYRGVFDAFPFPIQRYDFFRYLAIFHYGGFYFDLDVFLATGLAELLEHGCVFTYERISLNNLLRKEYKMDWEMGNYAFGAAQGHPFIRAIIDNCVRAQSEPDWAGMMINSAPWIFREDEKILSTTGPHLVSRTYAENPDIQTKVKVLFPENIYNRNNWYHFGIYGTHLMKSSWRKKKNKLHNIIQNYWEDSLDKKYGVSSKREN